jgi:HEAT repeat protein
MLENFHTPEAAQALVRGLIDPYGDIRDKSGNALARLGAPGVQALTGALKDQDPAIRKAALRVLGEIKPAQAFAAVLEIFEDEDEQIRRMAIDILGEIDSTAAVPPLIGLMEHRNPELQIAAAQALAKTGWQPGADGTGIRYSILRRDWEGCIKLGNLAIPHLIQAMQTQKDEIAQGVVKTLGSLLDPNSNPEIDERSQAEGIEALCAFLQRQKIAGSDEAVRILGRLGGERVVPGLIAATHYGYNAPLVIKSATEYLRKIGDHRAVLPLVKCLRRDCWNRDVRVALASSLVALYEKGNLDDSEKQSILSQRDYITSPHSDSHDDYQSPQNCSSAFDRDEHTDSGIGISFPL